VRASRGDKSHLVGLDHAIVVGVLAYESSLGGESGARHNWDTRSGLWHGLRWARAWVLGDHIDDRNASPDHLGDGRAGGLRLINGDRLVRCVGLLDGVGHLFLHIDVDGLWLLLGDGPELGHWAVGRVGDRLGDLDVDCSVLVACAWDLHCLVRGHSFHAVVAIIRVRHRSTSVGHKSHLVRLNDTIPVGVNSDKGSVGGESSPWCNRANSSSGSGSTIHRDEKVDKSTNERYRNNV